MCVDLWTPSTISCGTRGGQAVAGVIEEVYKAEDMQSEGEGLGIRN
jgi:hypothetical protein